MSAFFIVTTSIKDPEKFQEYAGKASQTFTSFGGKLVTKGKAESVLAGTSDHQNSAVVAFPDMDALTGWYNSADYQALIPLRTEAADMTLVAYSVPA
ncbi:MAG TPA: DUF1330 domain-containing protein [Rhodospirillales bacterium]|nr:DUF1330 domain-containing protein [Rhodospirillales bacterium]